MDFTECTVDTFMKAAFNQDFTKISEDDFKLTNIQWLDTSGLYLTREFELTVGIQNTRNRINCINIALKCHKDYIKEFPIPYLPALNIFEQFGYKLAWRNDLAEFEGQLSSIEMREKKRISILNSKIKELEKIKSDKLSEEPVNLKQSRAQFNKMLISLAKENYKIERNLTTMEELATIVVLHREVTKDKLANNGSKHS